MGWPKREAQVGLKAVAERNTGQPGARTRIAIGFLDYSLSANGFQVNPGAGRG